MKTLYLPYVIANYIFTLLNNSFLKMGIYTNNPELFKWVPANYGYELNTMLSYKDTLSHLVKVTCFFGDTQMGGAMWFLRTLFLVSILYGAFSVVVNVNNKLNIKYVLEALLFIFLASICSIYMKTSFYIPIYFMHCIVGILTFMLGIWMRRLSSYFTNKRIDDIYRAIAIPLLFAILVLLNKLGSIDIASVRIENVFCYMACSLSGWCFIKLCSNLILSYVKPLAWLTSWIGNRTMPIIILHFLAFKTVTYLYIKASNLPIVLLAVFPRLQDTNLWWAYGLVGVSLPLFCHELFFRIRIFVVQKSTGRK